MSQKTSGGKEISVRHTSSMPMHQKIYLYVLRNTTIDEKFKIKAYFENDIKYTFTRMEPIDEKSTNSPYIYRAELDLNINNQGRLYFNHENGPLLIEYYRLRLSRKIFKTDTTFRDYNDDTERRINNPHSTVHYFLFDVDFTRNLVDSPPGKNLS